MNFTSIPKPNNWDTLYMHQKIQLYKNYLGSAVAPYVDKLSAKAIAQSYGVPVAPLVRVLKDITAEDLREGWILKSTHGSGWNLWLNPTLDLNEVKQTLASWNKPYRPQEEPHYAHLLPRFYIEEQLEDKYLGKQGCIAYNIWCVRGNPIPCIRVKNRGNKNTYNFSWDLLDPPQIEFPIEKPVQFDQMLKYARKMSAPFEFVRMDFYVDAQDNVYFSEYTFTPNGGAPINSRTMEITASKYWLRRP